MTKKILFVDDEQNVLDGIRRQLRRDFDIDTANGGEDALKLLAENEYAVIVTDMRMPGMDGVNLLKRAEAIAPLSVRMMLTGNSDQQTAIDAVNHGQIFRFLNKPCATESLISSLQAGVKQYELVTAEKELLEKTLTGSIQALMDILALANPCAFHRAERIKHYVTQCVQGLNLPDGWKYEIAAMLSQIGYITIPPEILEKDLTGETLTPREQEMLRNRSKSTCQMIERIPRLEEITQMIALLDSDVPAGPDRDCVHTGALLLTVCGQFDQLLTNGLSHRQVMNQLSETPTPNASDILEVMEQVEPLILDTTIMHIDVEYLRVGMVLAEDIRTQSNIMIIKKGQIVTALMKERLRNFIQQNTLQDKVRVYESQKI
ncbi:MAG: response regulator [Pontiellaceae bacterium]|nr:response regulator [Pontiellaceae bacterium]MBN2786168.1 response regulator [Pontiellaceae bacterium]